MWIPESELEPRTTAHSLAAIDAAVVLTGLVIFALDDSTTVRDPNRPVTVSVEPLIEAIVPTAKP